MSSTALKTVLQEGLTLTHYYSLTNSGYHFATLVAVTHCVRIKMVLVSDRQSFNMQSSTNEGKLSLTESSGLIVCKLLCLFKLLMRTAAQALVA